MKVQILGMGCQKCKKLTEEAEAAVKLAGVEAEVEKVTGAREIAAFHVLSTPAIAIDGEVKAAGRVVPAAKIAEWLREAQN
jgi:small redox-active disulfide protein 2